MFQRIKSRYQSDQLVHKKIIEESPRTLTLENGSLAEKASRALTLSSEVEYPKPPTVEEVRQKLNKDHLARSKTTHSTAKRQPNWDKDDDFDSTSEYEPSRSEGKFATKQHAMEVGQSSNGAVATYNLVTGTPAEKDNADGLQQRKVSEYPGDARIAERANSAPNVNEEGAAIIGKGSKKKVVRRPMKQRLV